MKTKNKFPEDLIYKVWEEKRFNLPLTSAEGLPIDILDSGVRNNEVAGPDYQHAKIRIGNITFTGDVEIDTAHSDWKAHGHNINERYNKVILHVVLSNDSSYPFVVTQNGRKVPTLSIENHLSTSIKENINKNFGMPHPEGYRKALRLMRLAERWNLPVISFIDTPGAYPGIGAEERGQAEAIGRNILEAFEIRTPILVVVIGEGGSGGALGIGVGDRVLMLENAVYSVISPEGCAAIIWKDSKQAEKAAESLKLTAQDLFRLNIIDEIIPKPPGGAHTDMMATMN
ncbi:MAG TPA: DUF2851 family protein, partial [Ignavibacteriaceae bacterium]|nr:DUF2851 family protein [Ignavibacteriaceae bacterium]